MLYEHCAVNERGHLAFGGCDVIALARKYGTPLYLMDEDMIRGQSRLYAEAVKRYFRPGSRALYASKAGCIKAIYPILRQEGLCADVVSPGEIAIAMRAGFPAGDLYFHGNVKTPADVRFAIRSGVGCFIADNPEELKKIESAAAEAGIRQKV